MNQHRGLLRWQWQWKQLHPRLAARSDAHFVTLSVREHAERRSGNLLRWLNNRASQFCGPLEGCSYIINRYEEENLVVWPLAWADSDIGATFGTCVDERIARESAFGRNLPVKEICVEVSCCVGIDRADLGMDYGMGHVGAPDRSEHLDGAHYLVRRGHGRWIDNSAEKLRNWPSGTVQCRRLPLGRRLLAFTTLMSPTNSGTGKGARHTNQGGRYVWSHRLVSTW